MVQEGIGLWYKKGYGTRRDRVMVQEGLWYKKKKKKRSR